MMSVSPRRFSACSRLLPMKPAAPVTMMLMGTPFDRMNAPGYAYAPRRPLTCNKPWADGSGSAGRTIVVTEVALRVDAVANPLLERLGLGEAAVGLALPDLHAVAGDTEDAPVPGSRQTFPRSSAKVLSSSWASQAARSSHWHWVQ